MIFPHSPKEITVTYHVCNLCDRPVQDVFTVWLTQSHKVYKLSVLQNLSMSDIAGAQRSQPEFRRE